jgi:hypothetical protein
MLLQRFKELRKRYLPHQQKVPSMNKIAIAFGIFLFFSPAINAQIFKDLKKQVEKNVPGLSSNSLTEDEVVRGLKEALDRGIKETVEVVSRPDGYYLDEMIHIPIPKEANEVERRMRQLGQGHLVDEAVRSMNRAAEDAANGALDIFLDAIRTMSVTDAMGLLRGEDDAATRFLETRTRDTLTQKFEPVIAASLEKVGATKHWEAVFNTYNKIPLVKKVNPDLDAYVTEVALNGLFFKLAQEELNIRENPSARVTDLLKKVFGGENGEQED